MFSYSALMFKGCLCLANLLFLALKNKKSLYISPVLDCYKETEFEIWAGFGPSGQFRCHEFILYFITNLSRINETGNIDT